MYPGFIPYWMRHRRGEHRAAMGCGSGGRAGWSYSAAGEGEPGAFDFGGGAFGVRRPLRFLAYKLQLEEAQIAELARILDELKTERAQAAVDHRRAISAFADAIEGDSFNQEKAKSGAATRLASAERLRGAVIDALERLHKLLNAEQRSHLAYLIRTGTLSI
jgi:Spy/CpxP family protein refolding chaperone